MVSAVTVAEYAESRGADPDKMLRTLKRLGLPDPVAEAGGQAHYREADLDRVRGYAPGWVTLREYSDKHQISYKLLQGTWPTRYPDVWPEPVQDGQGRPVKRERAHVYAEGDLDRVRRVAAGLPPDEVGAPGDMLTRAQVAEYLGIAEGTVREAVWSGRLPGGEVGGDGVRRWRRGALDEARLGGLG